MDETDVRLCQLLMQNARTPLSDLADRLGITTTAVHRRIQDMIHSGVIKGFRTYMRGRFLGGTLVLVWGESKSRSMDTVIKSLESDDRTNAIALAGGNHLFIQVILRDMAELEGYIELVKKEAGIHEPMVGIQGLTKAASSQVEMKGAPKLTRLDYRIIGALEHNARKPVADVAKELDVSTKTVRAHLESMVQNNVIAFILDWNPGFSSGCDSYIFVTLKPGADKNKFRHQLSEKYSDRILMTVSFSNLPSQLLIWAWCPTTIEQKRCVDDISAYEDVSGIELHLMMSGHHVESWRDRIVRERAKKAT